MTSIATVVADVIERHLTEAATRMREAAQLVAQLDTMPSDDLRRICEAEGQASRGLVTVQNAIDAFKGGR